MADFGQGYFGQGYFGMSTGSCDTPQCVIGATDKIYNYGKSKGYQLEAVFSRGGATTLDIVELDGSDFELVFDIRNIFFSGTGWNSLFQIGNWNSNEGVLCYIPSGLNPFVRVEGNGTNPFEKTFAAPLGTITNIIVKYTSEDNVLSVSVNGENTLIDMSNDNMQTKNMSIGGRFSNTSQNHINGDYANFTAKSITFNGEELLTTINDTAGVSLVGGPYIAHSIAQFAMMTGNDDAALCLNDGYIGEEEVYLFDKSSSDRVTIDEVTINSGDKVSLYVRVLEALPLSSVSAKIFDSGPDGLNRFDINITAGTSKIQERSYAKITVDGVVNGDLVQDKWCLVEIECTQDGMKIGTIGNRYNIGANSTMSCEMSRVYINSRRTFRGMLSGVIVKKNSVPATTNFTDVAVCLNKKTWTDALPAGVAINNIDVSNGKLLKYTVNPDHLVNGDGRSLTVYAPFGGGLNGTFVDTAYCQDIGSVDEPRPNAILKCVRGANTASRFAVPNFRSVNGDWSVRAVFKRTSLTGGEFLFCETNTGNTEYGLNLYLTGDWSTGAGSISMFGQTGSVTKTDMSSNVWYDVLVEKVDNVTSLYVNGTLEDVNTNSAYKPTVNNGANKSLFGRSDNTFVFEGELALFEYYDPDSTTNSCKYDFSKDHGSPLLNDTIGGDDITLGDHLWLDGPGLKDDSQGLFLYGGDSYVDTGLAIDSVVGKSIEVEFVSAHTINETGYDYIFDYSPGQTGFSLRVQSKRIEFFVYNSGASAYLMSTHALDMFPDTAYNIKIDILSDKIITNVNGEIREHTAYDGGYTIPQGSTLKIGRNCEATQNYSPIGKLIYFKMTDLVEYDMSEYEGGVIVKNKIGSTDGVAVNTITIPSTEINGVKALHFNGANNNALELPVESYNVEVEAYWCEKSTTGALLKGNANFLLYCGGTTEERSLTMQYFDSSAVSKYLSIPFPSRNDRIVNDKWFKVKAVMGNEVIEISIDDTVVVVVEDAHSNMSVTHIGHFGWTGWSGYVRSIRVDGGENLIASDGSLNVPMVKTGTVNVFQAEDPQYPQIFCNEYNDNYLYVEAKCELLDMSFVPKEFDIPSETQVIVEFGDVDLIIFRPVSSSHNISLKWMDSSDSAVYHTLKSGGFQPNVEINIRLWRDIKRNIYIQADNETPVVISDYKEPGSYVRLFSRIITDQDVPGTLTRLFLNGVNYLDKKNYGKPIDSRAGYNANLIFYGNNEHLIGQYSEDVNALEMNGIEFSSTSTNRHGLFGLSTGGEVSGWRPENTNDIQFKIRKLDGTFVYPSIAGAFINGEKTDLSVVYTPEENKCNMAVKNDTYGIKETLVEDVEGLMYDNPSKTVVIGGRWHDWTLGVFKLDSFSINDNRFITRKDWGGIKLESNGEVIVRKNAQWQFTPKNPEEALVLVGSKWELGFSQPKTNVEIKKDTEHFYWDIKKPAVWLGANSFISRSADKIDFSAYSVWGVESKYNLHTWKAYQGGVGVSMSSPVRMLRSQTASVDYLAGCRYDNSAYSNNTLYSTLDRSLAIVDDNSQIVTVDRINDTLSHTYDGVYNSRSIGPGGVDGALMYPIAVNTTSSDASRSWSEFYIKGDGENLFGFKAAPGDWNKINIPTSGLLSTGPMYLTGDNARWILDKPDKFKPVKYGGLYINNTKSYVGYANASLSSTTSKRMSETLMLGL